MNILNGIRRFFFQKASTDFDANEAFRRNQLRYNALRALDPDVLVRHLEAFQRGDICGLERVIDEFEQREDKMRIGSFKMAAAVSSKPWKVQIRQGEEENPRAKLHQEHLTKFWNRVEATDAFCRNRKGGLRLLVKQMMSAQSRVYSVHDICWKVNGDGTLNATFTHVPAWCFENRTGRLRYIRNDCDTVGAEMPDGEWLVTVGEGVGVAAAVIAMAKRLSWNDWLLFSEKCGMPVILGNTNAQRDTPAWAAMSRAIRAIAPKTGLLADTGTTLNAVSMGAGGQNTYRELVDTVDRAISALYRGGDLATQSSGPDAAGVNAQAGESELMDDDGCKMVAETLRDQVEKFVIRFELGDFEPLAEIVINPPADTDDVEREMKIDTHLSGLGVKLSKKDALARYGRTEAEDENDALTPPQTPPQGGFGGLANEQTPKTPLQNDENRLQNAPRVSDGQGDPQAEDALVEALSGLFEKSLAEAAAEAVSQEGDDGRAGAPRTPSQKSQPSQNGEEITQEKAEELYEEMMAK
jgi:phage gp29-like protein